MVLSGTASAINYIKSYSDDPEIRLHVTDSNRYCPGLYAQNVIPHLLPPARDAARYRATLDRLLSENDIDVLIPTSDYDVEGVAEYLHSGWTPKPALFRPPYEAFRLLSHKARLMAHLEAGLPAIVPRTWQGDTDSGLLAFPIVVKPISESGGKGVTIVQHRDDLAASVARIRKLYGDGFLLQEFIPGRTYVATLVYDQNGDLAIGVAMRSNLTFFTWGGGGCAGEMVDSPALVRLTDEVVKACGGWRGPINFEWREHSETGAFHLMEANCRLNGYSYLTTMNGVCLPRVVLALLTGTPLPRVSAPKQRDRNFVLGFRETSVDRWLQPTR
jgi:predicted ATP-grasp superfamily ATP-dependent carboligase